MVQLVNINFMAMILYAALENIVAKNTIRTRTTTFKHMLIISRSCNYPNRQNGSLESISFTKITQVQ